MAIANNNLLLKGVSGRIGDIVIRQRKDGKTIIARRPVRRRKTILTAAQLAQQQRFTVMVKSKQKK